MATAKKATGNGRTTNRLPKDTEVTSIVKVQPLKKKTIRLELIGLSPLVVHNFDEKSRQQMLEKQMGEQKKVKLDPRCPVEEFLQAFYWVDPSEPPKPDNTDKDTGQRHYDEKRVVKIVKESTFGLPVTGFKNAIISAARNTDLTMAGLKQQLYVSSPENSEFAIIRGATPHMDNRICRLAGAARTPIERFRPMWDEWSTTIDVTFDGNMLNEDTVANLVEIAGFYVGVFEGRPERSALSWGQFEIKKG